MTNPFSKRLTKWIPLAEYQHGYSQFLVLVRGSRKTGELFFKTKKVNRSVWPAEGTPIGMLPIKVSEQWDLLQKTLNS